MKEFNYNILGYWDDQDDLYVNYKVINSKTGETVNTISYYNTSDIPVDYDDATPVEIKECLLDLLTKNNGAEFNLPKISKASPLLTYIYDSICYSESNMFFADYEDWKELKEEENFKDEDFLTLEKEIVQYNLQEAIEIDSNEYRICGYGGLQCFFNDDRERNMTDYER